MGQIVVKIAHFFSRDTRSRRRFLLLWVAAFLCFGIPASLTGCEKTPPAGHAPVGPLDPDNDPDAIVYSQLGTRLGAVPKTGKPYRIGVVVKFLGNEYWKLLADGMQSSADRHGIALDVQGAATESDREGQLFHHGGDDRETL